MTPIATKDLGVGEDQLNRRIAVWQIGIDAKSEIVTVVYNIQVISPSGTVVTEGDPLTYIRYNKEGNMKFNLLRESAVGQMIIAMIDGDLDLYPNLEQD